MAKNKGMALYGVPRLPKYKLTEGFYFEGVGPDSSDLANKKLFDYLNVSPESAFNDKWQDSLFIEDYDWTNRLITGYQKNWRTVPEMGSEAYRNSDSAPEDRKILLQPIGYHIGIMRRLAYFIPTTKVGGPLINSDGSDIPNTFTAENWDKFASYYIPNKGTFSQDFALRSNRTIIINYHPFTGPIPEIRASIPFGDIVNRFKARLDKYNISLYKFYETGFGFTIYGNSNSETGLGNSRPALVIPFLYKKHKSKRDRLNDRDDVLRDYLVTVDDTMVGGDLLYITEFPGEYYCGVEAVSDPINTNVIKSRKPFISQPTINNSVAIIERMRKLFNSIEIHTVTFYQPNSTYRSVDQVLGALKDTTTSQLIAEDVDYFKDQYNLFKTRCFQVIDAWINEHFGTK